MRIARYGLVFALLTCVGILPGTVGGSLFPLHAGQAIAAQPHIGDVVDALDGVNVYYNGPIGNVTGRNTAKDGYNLGLRYQCVEFVKRYYYEHYNHKMPDSYGHAKDFFDPKTGNGKINRRRNLIQYANGHGAKPHKGDLLVFDGTPFNSYGHVAIVASASETELEMIQQNPGPQAPPRIRLAMQKSSDGGWLVDSDTLLGWLRKP